MARSGALPRRGLGIAIDHGSRLPASHQHQLVLIATLSQPAGREGMPELMRMHGRQSSGPSPVVNHLIDARRRHGPVAANPGLDGPGTLVLGLQGAPEAPVENQKMTTWQLPIGGSGWANDIVPLMRVWWSGWLRAACSG
jgi:hypothetical protein